MNPNLKYILVLFAGVFCSLFSLAQTSTYSVSYASSNPKNKTGTVLNTQADNSVTGWTKLTSITASAASNKWSGNITLPFTFKYFGESVTACKVSLNGLLTFNTSSSALPSGDNESLPSFSIPTKTICGFWDKFTVQAPTGTNDLVYYRTFGTSPNRQFWIKWNSFEIGGSSANLAANDVCFAIVLEETTYNVYLVDMYKGTPTSLSLSGTEGLQYSPYTFLHYTGKTALVGSTTAYSNNFYLKYAPSALTTSTEDTLSYSTTDLSYCTSYSLSRNLYPQSPSSCMTSSLQDAKLFIKVDLGEDYEYGQQNLFPDSCGAEVKLLVYNSSGTTIFADTVRLVINQNSVEKVYVAEIDEFSYSGSSYSYTDIAYVNYTILDYESSSNSNVNSDLNLYSWIDTEYSYKVTSSPYDASSMITLSTPTASGNQYLFKWTSACDAPNYEFQLLRLFNTDIDYQDNLQKAAGIVDWNKALKINVVNGDTSLLLHLTEGTGYYAWRVRPIGNYYEGEEANDKNWGVWSSGYNQDDAYDIKATTVLGADAFYYTQFDPQKNWIYNRVFTEDNAIGESISFANGLGQLKQSQRHLQTDGFILANALLYDYSGRAALKSLNGPVNQNYFSYQSKLLTTDGSGSELYRAKDYDSTDTYNNPSKMLGGEITEYYSDNNTDLTIPDANGYPFSRELYYADGTNRPREISAPGAIFRMGSTQSGEDRTIKIYYSSVADDELIRVFGDEAYADIAVSKRVQIDPNKIINVSYTTVEGTTIATCLADDGDNALLEDLEVNSFNVNDTIEGNAAVSSTTFVKEKGFILNMPTTLWVNYSLTPAEIEAECGTYCSTCDYTVYGYMKQDGEVIWDTTITVEASECSSSSNFSFSHTESVEPASYLIGRTITLYNENASTGNTYYDEHLDTMAAIMDQHLEDSLSEMYAYLEADDVEGFYQYLVDNNYATQTQIDNEEDIIINTGCCEITIPVEMCPPHPCDDGTPDFEAVLYSFWEEDYGNAMKNYAYNNSKHFDFPDNASLNEGRVAFTFPSTPRVVSTGSCSDNLTVKLQYTASDGSAAEFDIVSSCLESYVFSTEDDIASAIANEMWNAMEAVYGSNNDTWPYVFSSSGNEVWIKPQLETFSRYHGVLEGSLYIDAPNYDVDLSNAEFDYTASDDYPYGKGAFNALIENMIEDGYPCDTLYDYWYALSSAWESMQYDSDGNTQDFNIIEAFLESVGRMWGDTSLHQYGDDSDPGYITHAHKAVYYNEGTCDDCEDNYDFATLLADDSYDDTRLESDSTKSWEEFIQCTQGDCSGDLTDDFADLGYDFSSCDGTDAVACAEEMLTAIEDSCYSLCSARRESFETQILAEYAAAGRSISDDELDCLVEALIAECESGCGLTIYHHAEDTTGDGVTDVEVVDSVGNSYEIQAMTESLIYTFDLALPSGGKSCESMGYQTIYFSDTLSVHVVELMNEYLATFIAAGYTNLTATQLTAMFENAYMELGDTVNCDLDLKATEYFTVDANSYFYISSTRRLYISCTYSYSGDYFLYNYAAATSGCEKITFCGPLCFKWVAPELDSANYTVEIESCEESAAEYLMGVIDLDRDNCKNQYVEAMSESYENTCASSSNINDFLVAGYTLGYHHYTLFFYDRAGNLIQTVSPKGVDTSCTSRMQHPSDSFVTNYNYNSRKQLLSKTTPDGGTTQFWYNDLGQLRFSQNAQQASDRNYSYLTYDALGRVIEAGQARICPTCEITSVNKLDENVNNKNIPSTGSERIYTIYSDAASGITYVDADGNSSSQEYLQNRISYVYNDDNNYTYYSYDPHGNVQWLIQAIDGLPSKQIKFEYDLISGKITDVKYQEGQEDQYYYRYSYDADNRITDAYTSRNNVIWDHDAHYEYYQHGPLKRTVLGEDGVQGLDYLYTLQGWLKAVNHPDIGNGKDIGQDGVSGSSNQRIAQDAFGMVINYYQGDFSRSGSEFNNNNTSTIFNSLSSTHGLSGTDVFRSYYNGFIGNVVSNNSASVTKRAGEPMAGMYLYDEVGRLVQNTVDFYSGSSWLGNSGSVSDYYEFFEYDGNGNITSVIRNGY